MIVIIVRTIIVFAVLVLTMRLMGKRQLGELELSELVVAVLISNFAAHPLQDIAIPIINGLMPALVLLCCELIMSGIALRSPKARALMYGKPSILIAEGIIDQMEMRSNRFTLDELHEELRKQAIMDISKVKYAILETDGTLNVVLFPAETPVTPMQLGLPVDDPGKPTIVINDGRVISDNLIKCGKNEGWLGKELNRRNVKSTKDVYLMSIDAMGQIYFAAKQRGKGK